MIDTSEEREKRIAVCRARKDRFDELCSRFSCRRPCELVAVHDLDRGAFDRLHFAARIYLSRVLKSGVTLTEHEILRQFEEWRFEIMNVTPTGMVLPKNYSILEFNLLMREFYRAMSTLGIDDLIDVWQIPMHIRIKYPDIRRENIDRPRHAPEDRHIDSWSGYSTHGITVLVPLLGDVEHNNVEFFRPLEGVDEEWLVPRPKGEDRGLDGRYEPVKYGARRGEVILFDAASLHATRRDPGCGIRFSIDNIFVPKIKPAGSTEYIEQERTEEQATHTDLLTVGEDAFFSFAGTDRDFKDSRGGKIDPTSFSLMYLQSRKATKYFL